MSWMSDEIATPAPGPARQALAALRLQAYGTAGPNHIIDPVVEPMWVGIRALGSVDAGVAAMVDGDGHAIEGFDELVNGLGVAVPSSDVVVEGTITKQTEHAGSGGVAWSEEMPSMSGFIGLRRNRAAEAAQLKEDNLRATTFGPDDLLAFVITDLLWVDDTSLLDVPLLERRRLLESVVTESDAIRVGAYVRPPVEHWVGSWRSQGFGGLTYKAANSRYRPGEANPDWVITGMPRR
jgi:hypothetical protein